MLQHHFICGTDITLFVELLLQSTPKIEPYRSLQHLLQHNTGSSDIIFITKLIFLYQKI